MCVKGYLILIQDVYNAKTSACVEIYNTKLLYCILIFYTHLEQIFQEEKKSIYDCTVDNFSFKPPLGK